MQSTALRPRTSTLKNPGILTLALLASALPVAAPMPVSYTHLRAHET